MAAAPDKFASPSNVRATTLNRLSLFVTSCIGITLATRLLSIWTTTQPEPTIVDALDATEFSFSGIRTQTIPGNTSCVLFACHTPGATGSELFASHYGRSGYTVHITTFDSLSYAGVETHPAWCRVPAALSVLRALPAASRAVYADLDTLLDVGTWCALPLSRSAPIVMNSLFRYKPIVRDLYTVRGAAVQANVFAVANSPAGAAALVRWERAHRVRQGMKGALLRDQGAVHMQEKGLCGVPGWIVCYRNPLQQRCHCAGHFEGHPREKERCIHSLYDGTKQECPLSVNIRNSRGRLTIPRQ